MRISFIEAPTPPPPIETVITLTEGEARKLRALMGANSGRNYDALSQSRYVKAEFPEQIDYVRFCSDIYHVLSAHPTINQRGV